MSCTDHYGNVITAGCDVKRLGDNGRSTVVQVVEHKGRKWIRIREGQRTCYNPANFFVVAR